MDFSRRRRAVFHRCHTFEFIITHPITALLLGMGLTGTPAGNGLMDLFAEFKLLDTGERLGRFIVQRSVSQKHIGGEHYSISSSAFLILTARYSLVGRSILKRPSKLPTFSTVMFHVSIMSTVYILLSSI